MNNRSNEKHVRVLVHTKPENGYPPEEWEKLWTIEVKNGHYKVDNIPFYAKDLSCDDIIEAKLEGEDYIFVRVVSRSENSTIRVIIYDLDDDPHIRKSLCALGCAVEGVGTPGLIAVNVPKNALPSVQRFLDEGHENERLDYEEGALRL